MLLVFGAPCQPRLLAGQEHGRTIPLADILMTKPKGPSVTPELLDALLLRLDTTVAEPAYGVVQSVIAPEDFTVNDESRGPENPQ